MGWEDLFCFNLISLGRNARQWGGESFIIFPSFLLPACLWPEIKRELAFLPSFLSPSINSQCFNLTRPSLGNTRTLGCSFCPCRFDVRRCKTEEMTYREGEQCNKFVRVVSSVQPVSLTLHTSIPLNGILTSCCSPKGKEGNFKTASKHIIPLWCFGSLVIFLSLYYEMRWVKEIPERNRSQIFFYLSFSREIFSLTPVIIIATFGGESSRKKCSDLIFGNQMPMS